MLASSAVGIGDAGDVAASPSKNFWANLVGFWQIKAKFGQN